MAERKNAKAMAGGSLQDRTHAGLDVPLQGNTTCLYTTGQKICLMNLKEVSMLTKATFTRQ